MRKVILSLGSRTAWTVVALFIVNGLTAVRTALPQKYLPAVDAVLGLLAIYFHVNPSQDYR